MPGGYLRNFCEKTQMCKFYKVGACSKGKKCAFAHSLNDLRTPPDLSCTKLCPTLIAMGACTDNDCRFAHNKEQLRRINPQSNTRKPPKKVPAQVRMGHMDGSPGSDASTSFSGVAVLETSGFSSRSVSCPDEAISTFSGAPKAIGAWETVDSQAQHQEIFQMSQGNPTQWPEQPVVPPLAPQWVMPKPWETGIGPLASSSGSAAAIPPPSPSLTSSEGNSPRPTREASLFDDSHFFARSVSCPDSTLDSALEAFGKWETENAQAWPQLRVNVKNTFLEVEPMQSTQCEMRRHSVHGHPGEQQSRRASKASCGGAAEEFFRMEQPTTKEEEDVRSPVQYRRHRNPKDWVQSIGGPEWASQQPAPRPVQPQAAQPSNGGMPGLAMPRLC